MLEVNQTRRLYLLVKKNLERRDRECRAIAEGETGDEAEKRVRRELLKQDNDIRDAMNEIESTREFFNEIKRTSDKDVINKPWII